MAVAMKIPMLLRKEQADDFSTNPTLWEEEESMRRIWHHCEFLEYKIKALPYFQYSHARTFPISLYPSREAYWVSSQDATLVSNGRFQLLRLTDDIVPIVARGRLFLTKVYHQAAKFLPVYNDGPLTKHDGPGSSRWNLVAEYQSWKTSAIRKLWVWYGNLPMWMKDLVSFSAAWQPTATKQQPILGGSSITDILSLHVIFYGVLMTVYYPAMIMDLWDHPSKKPQTLEGFIRCQEARENYESVVQLMFLTDQAYVRVNILTDAMCFMFIWANVCYVSMWAGVPIQHNITDTQMRRVHRYYHDSTSDIDEAITSFLNRYVLLTVTIGPCKSFVHQSLYINYDFSTETFFRLEVSGDSVVPTEGTTKISSADDGGCGHDAPEPRAGSHHSDLRWAITHYRSAYSGTNDSALGPFLPRRYLKLTAPSEP
ncbi:uncharacterized protein BJ171DRAFT_84191 [Polychytrium aggregatum]|uniref:uncharacterized protein n=1 Tax=Polychytrium aggregatum TaxID=110093 RepID=UPI0022FF3337|nr:uncharacterized protein BJ171DRAFT_84191 [Polychytrium aggregatum]KAI9205165.1 hypothetical protein BJ171DRAFT_84191 [Polychytrium aggregatum]